MSERRRRKSLNIFKPTLTPLSPDRSPDSPSEESLVGRKKKGRHSSILSNFSTPASPASPVGSPDLESLDKTDSFKVRPRTLQKSSRSSVFGSIRSLRSLEDEEKLSRSYSKASSIDDEEITSVNGSRRLFGDTVIYHGEVQTSGGMFRKRTQYLVLTDSYLIRFRSHSKASEMYPAIPPPIGRGHSSRQSVASISSFQDMQMSAYNDITSGIALNHIVAVYKLDDGRPYFSIEVSHLDENLNRGSSMNMQLNDPKDCDIWLDAIRSAASAARLSDGHSFHQGILEYVARTLEHERDYDPNHFHLFKVVQRASNKAVGRSSSDDLSKLNSTLSYLVVGMNKIHLVPLSKAITRSSSAVNELEVPVSFGITTLSAFSMQGGDDAFQTIFRLPAQKPHAVHLASCQATEIAFQIRAAAEYLRPEWLQQPIFFNVPVRMDEYATQAADISDDHRSFDRTLVAYCAGYKVDTSLIRYTIEYNCEDSPTFRLLSPGTPLRTEYTALELLAVFRALRYNESFATISFSGVNLNVLQNLYDPYGVDIDSKLTRSGSAVNIQGHEILCLLSQEVRALAIKSKRLRRLDFSFCFSRGRESGDETRNGACGIPEALSPLCKKSLTNVDWLVLNGIKLGEDDIDHLVDAAAERACHLRAVEVSGCDLSVHEVDVLLSTLAAQESTLEVINISGVQGRISPEMFQRQIGYFGHIRKINLARVQRTTGPEPLIAPETLMAWRLEELVLSHTPMNEKTIDSISAYLACWKSDTLRELQIDQCGLTGSDLAIFLRSMGREGHGARNMHISASENRLWNGHSALFDAISKDFTPTHLTMRMIEFEKERHFRDLVQALARNKTLKILDISKASLPYNASAETCEDLKKMFAENHTLEELDISGEHAHLDATSFGIGLNLALTGLKKNKTLKILKIEHQNLGLQGANTLAEVLEENDTLVEVHCENNNINLQSFSVLVNALRDNQTLLYMPLLQRDRETSFERMRREIEASSKFQEPPALPVTGTTLRRTFTAAKNFKTGRSSNESATLRHPSPGFTAQDIRAGLEALNDKWDVQVTRLQRYLSRNYHLAHGLPVDDFSDSSSTRPSSTSQVGGSDLIRSMFEQMQIDRTPTTEKEIGLGIEAIDEKAATPDMDSPLELAFSET
ncbi:MAG: hypothetical protein Q9227_003034 [Pyrenula ochraceoflavens]